MTEINLLSLQNDCTGKCLDFIRDHDFKYYETEEVLKEIGKSEYSPFTYIGKVYALKTMDEVVQFYKNFCEALIEAKKIIIEKKNDEEIAKIERENLRKLKEQEEKNQKELENSSKETSKNEDFSQETIDRLSREKENYKKTAKEEIKKSDSPMPANNNNDDDNWKKKFIGDIEMDLAKKNISQERLSKRLGVSDWKEKINGASTFHEALSRRSDLWDIIWELKNDSDNEFTCASCGQKKTEYYRYPLEGGIKYCSAKCWDKGEKKDNKNDSPSKNQGDNFGFSSVNEFFAWMKKLGVDKIEFDFNTNQVVISCKGGKKLNVSDSSSGLTTRQQRALNERFKSEREPITFGQVQSKLDKGDKNKNSNVGIIAAILVAGLVLAVVIGVVIHKNKKRDY